MCMNHIFFLHLPLMDIWVVSISSLNSATRNMNADMQNAEKHQYSILTHIYGI